MPTVPAKTTIKVAITNNAAKDDSFSGSGLEWLSEDGSLVGSLNVLGNDPGSAHLWAVSSTAPTGTGYLPQESVGSTDSFNVDFHGNTYQGVLTLNADGTVGFDLSSILGEIGSLAEGESIMTTFYYTARMANGALSTAKVTIEITGENDAPTLAATTGLFFDTEFNDDFSPIGGQLPGHDVDHNAVLHYGFVGSETGESPYGALTVGADGTWSFDPDDAAINALKTTEIVTFNVYVEDEHGARAESTVTITLHGANDAPTLAPVAPGSVAEVDQSSATLDAGLSGTLVGADVDAGETLVYGIAGGTDNGDGTVSYVGGFGTLTVTTATGGYVYVKNAAAIEALDTGDTPVDSFSVTVSDGDGAPVAQTYSINLTGADDTPTLAPVAPGSVAEVDQSGATLDAGLSGTLVGADVDAGETLVYGIVGGTDNGDGTVSYVGSFGTLTVTTATGGYVYVKNAAAIEALDTGDTSVDSFSVTVSDGDGAPVAQTYSINLTGADDAPTLAPVAPGSVAEVDQSSATLDAGLSGTLAGADVDAGDTLVYGIVGGTDHGDGTVSYVGSFGTLTVTTATGGYVYVKNAAAIEALDAGDAPVDSFSVTVSDGDGALVAQTYSVNLTGADDGPIRQAPTDIDLVVNPASVTQNNVSNFNFSASIVATDTDSGGFSFTFADGSTSLTNGGNIFAISGNTLSTGNLAGSTTYTLTLRATQTGDPAGMFYDETFQIITGKTGNQDDTLPGGTPSSTDDVLFGGAGIDVIFGGTGDDTLFGQGGADQLNGDAGNDTLYGGAGADFFVFLTKSDGVDMITDFSVVDDTIRLENSGADGFSALTTLGTLNSAAFYAGGAAHDADDRIIYNPVDGKLYYDADGNGAGAAIHLATLGTGLAITNTDFVVI
ncbi:VCBS domain-containing protein [Sphingomonas sp. LaA6.9]|uniref:VCBS domain-containing protein n=1 Tax=Sphingomonas sp. LaA6.9 TaxID=2919914 RepID=UPI001F4F8765|nr:VCBS domain-containing protein [Sphingomonas sp. LaA6.9]MCJ8157947.1 VCBS domain-containing protein [Sphingomonas sp. LaA6.9]